MIAAHTHHTAQSPLHLILPGSSPLRHHVHETQLHDAMAQAIPGLSSNPASAPACNPSCLCSSMQSTPPRLWQATYPNLDSAPLPLGTLMTPQGRCNIGALFCMSSMTSPFQQTSGKSDPAYHQWQNCSGPHNHFLMPTPHSWAYASRALWDLTMQQSTTFTELQQG